MLYVAETALRTNKPLQLPGLAERYVGKLGALLVFISVIFFTSKLADNSEIIAMRSNGMSFRRLLKPYMISAGIIAIVSFLLGAYVIPHSNVTRLNFENTYIKKRQVSLVSNVQL